MKKNSKQARAISPVGDSVADDVRDHLNTDAQFRKEYERLAPYAAIASQVILRRGELGLTQKQLAEKIGTKNTVISRIESGRNPTSVRTLQRIAEALDLELVIDFKKISTKSKTQQKIAA